MRNLICPISPLRVNESVVRLTALLIALCTLGYMFTGSSWIVLLLIVDFTIRAFTGLKYSPISWLTMQLRTALQLPEAMVDKAPKIFAARVGFLFALAIFVLSFIHPLSSLVLALVLVTFALLEAVFNLCVGCLVYTFLVFPLYQPRIPAKDVS